MKKIFSKAFSLVELMVTLVVVAILTAAMAPVITKRLKSKEITVVQGSSGSNEVSTDCGGLFNEDCKLCNINFCLECEKTCEDGTYKNISRCNCTSCETHCDFCTTCDSVGCLSCETDYKLENGICKLSATTKEFITAGTHELTVPAGVTQLNVTLVSGGAGGGGGAAIDMNEYFVVSDDGSFIQDEFQSRFLPEDYCVLQETVWSFENLSAVTLIKKELTFGWALLIFHILLSCYNCRPLSEKQ